MSRRTERIASEIRRTLGAAIIHRLNDPRIEPLTSITRVEVAPDFALARIWISVMAPEARQNLTLEAIRAATGRLRRILGEQVILRQVPELDFRLDQGLKRGLDTLAVLDRLEAERNAAQPDESANQTTPDPADPASDAEESSRSPSISSTSAPHRAPRQEDS